MNFKEKLQQNIPKFYLFSFLQDCMFVIPVIVLFWQQNGLSLTDIMLLQSIFAIAIVFLEVPTGVIADKWGRKNSLIVGSILAFVSITIYSLGHSFSEFVIAEILTAAGVCFFSGADSAFLYESLKQVKQEKNFKKVNGNARSLGYLAGALAAIIGGLVAIKNIRMNLYLEAVFMFILIFVAISFKEPKHSKKLEEKNYWQHTLNCLKEAGKNKELLFLVLFSGLLASFLKITLWFYQPYMKAVGLGIAYFGIFWATFALFSIGGSKFAHNIEKKLGETKSLWLIVLLPTLATIFMGITPFLFGIFFIYLHQFVRGFNLPVIQDYTNRRLSSNKRATLLSIQSLAGSLLFVILSPLFGWIADTYSLNTSLILVGSTFLIFFVLLIYWKKTNHNNP
ncbi:MFS transporter [Candidatus Pacearchaeota archaeon]|nr:MFS transporter [Candidatus Pacearchaeota archaeon]